MRNSSNSLSMRGTDKRNNIRSNCHRPGNNRLRKSKKAPVLITKPSSTSVTTAIHAERR